MLALVGSLALIVAFVATLAAGAAFVLAARQNPDGASWMRVGRWSWAAMAASLALSAGVLWTALFGRHFEIAYVYQQTSRAMPWHYTLSSFWAGQEGSFLLWAMMTAAVGGLLVRWSVRAGEAQTVFAPIVLAVVALCQAFLLSMIVGLKLGPLPIGVSPFVSLAAKFPDAPMLQVAGFVPADGQGLNDLLQNPWMVIHPPTLFVGFTLLMVPFAFAAAGLVTRKYTQWVRPALPWALAGTGVLGIGIMMGGYWAYETLSFGGWWAWDPVENASLVPWLFAVAGLHTLVVQKKTAAGNRAAFVLTVLAFQFVIYSTFLTRSGVLGDVSVHSFVDLGLYNQLLLWIGSIGALGFGLLAWRWRDLPAPVKAPEALSRESMVFTGALLLALTGVVIALGTSAPIIGQVFRNNPSAVPAAFYTTWTLPLAVGIAFLAGLGQTFWWRRMSVEDVNRVLLKPVVLTVAATAAVVLFTPFVPLTVQATAAPNVPQTAQAGVLPAPVETFFASHGTSLLLLLLLFSAFFTLFGNAIVMARVGRGNLKMVGGSLTHVGFALMLLGIVASGVFNDSISDNAGTDIQGSRENVVVPLGETIRADGYSWTYRGQETNAEGRPVYVMDVTDRRGATFQTRNVVYKDGRDQWIQHPEVREGFVRDLYVAVFPSAMSETPAEGASAAPEEVTLAQGDSLVLDAGENKGAYSVRFVDYDLAVDLDAVGLSRDSVDLAVAAKLDVRNTRTGETRLMRPVYVIDKQGRQMFVQNQATDWGLGLTFTGMVIDEGAIKLLIDGAAPAEEEWVVVQAYEKPFLSLLWIGTIVLGVGFAVSFGRRLGESRR